REEQLRQMRRPGGYLAYGDDRRSDEDDSSEGEDEYGDEGQDEEDEDEVDDTSDGDMSVDEEPGFPSQRRPHLLAAAARSRDEMWRQMGSSKRHERPADLDGPHAKRTRGNQGSQGRRTSAVAEASGPEHHPLTGTPPEAREAPDACARLSGTSPGLPSVPPSIDAAPDESPVQDADLPSMAQPASQATAHTSINDDAYTAARVRAKQRQQALNARPWVITLINSVSSLPVLEYFDVIDREPDEKKDGEWVYNWQCRCCNKTGNHTRKPTGNLVTHLYHCQDRLQPRTEGLQPWTRTRPSVRSCTSQAAAAGPSASTLVPPNPAQSFDGQAGTSRPSPSSLTARGSAQRLLEQPATTRSSPSASAATRSLPGLTLLAERPASPEGAKAHGLAAHSAALDDARGENLTAGSTTTLLGRDPGARLAAALLSADLSGPLARRQRSGSDIWPHQEFVALHERLASDALSRLQRVDGKFSITFGLVTARQEWVLVAHAVWTTPTFEPASTCLACVPVSSIPSGVLPGQWLYRVLCQDSLIGRWTGITIALPSAQNIQVFVDLRVAVNNDATSSALLLRFVPCFAALIRQLLERSGLKALLALYDSVAELGETQQSMNGQEKLIEAHASPQVEDIVSSLPFGAFPTSDLSYHRRPGILARLWSVHGDFTANQRTRYARFIQCVDRILYTIGSGLAAVGDWMFFIDMLRAVCPAPTADLEPSVNILAGLSANLDSLRTYALRIDLMDTGRLLRAGHHESEPGAALLRSLMTEFAIVRGPALTASSPRAVSCADFTDFADFGDFAAGGPKQDRPKDDVDRYLAQQFPWPAHLRTATSTSALTWWAGNARELPNLAALARILLHVPAASSHIDGYRTALRASVAAHPGQTMDEIAILTSCRVLSAQGHGL
ncbi:hypothetical protein OC844_007467, partial [Tilletia horrida]